MRIKEQGTHLTLHEHDDDDDDDDVSFLQVFRWTDKKALIGYFSGYANAPNKHMF